MSEEDDKKQQGEPLKPVELEGYGRVEDSRLKGYKAAVTHPTLPLERSFCTKCGAPYGWVSMESSYLISAAAVVVFCERCEAEMNKKLGPIPLKVAGDEDTREFPELRKGSLPSRLGE